MILDCPAWNTTLICPQNQRQERLVFYLRWNYSLFIKHELSVAKITEQLTWHDVLLMSVQPEWMAPEVLRNEPANEKWVKFNTMRIFLNVSTEILIGMLAQMWRVQLWCYIVGISYFTHPLERFEPDASRWSCGIPESTTWNPRWYRSNRCTDNPWMLANVSSFS